MALIPDYRVRVFLSVDLSGSTAFKAKLKSTLWIRTFKKFYTQFLKTFRSQYVYFCESHEECKKYSEEYPRLWKTIGDEAVFVNRIKSLFHLFAYVHAFDAALKEYKSLLKADDETNSLDVKGNGWIASFPFPNQTIAMDDADKDGFEESLPDESHEAGADISPGRYEFLGPGIDAGFRISANSTAGFFTLSPALACILCRANTNRDYSRYKFDLHYRGVNKLKGVISGEDYPIVGLDTERDANRVKLIKLQSTLDGTSQVDSGSLIDYLEKFIEFHKIEMPSLELNGVDSSIQAPISYQESFVPEWTKLNEELISRDANFTESAQERDDANGNSTQSTSALKELIDALASLQKAMQ